MRLKMYTKNWPNNHKDRLKLSLVFCTTCSMFLQISICFQNRFAFWLMKALRIWTKMIKIWADRYVIVKFVFSMKAKKIDEIFTANLTLNLYCQINGEISAILEPGLEKQKNPPALLVYFILAFFFYFPVGFEEKFQRPTWASSSGSLSKKILRRGPKIHVADTSMKMLLGCVRRSSTKEERTQIDFD